MRKGVQWSDFLSKYMIKLYAVTTAEINWEKEVLSIAKYLRNLTHKFLNKDLLKKKKPRKKNVHVKFEFHFRKNMRV